MLIIRASEELSFMSGGRVVIMSAIPVMLVLEV